MPAGIKVRVADGRLLIWKGNDEYRRMNPTDEECKAAWQAEGVVQNTKNGFYSVLPRADAGEGFILVPCDEHVEGQETTGLGAQPDQVDVAEPDLG